MELLLYVLIGCILGVLTGMIPGLHINTVSAIALGLFAMQRFELAALLAAMGIVHTFVDFIPSVSLGVPQEDNLLSVLPGHKLFLQGRGYHAIMLTVWGGLVGGMTAVLLSGVFMKFLEKASNEIAAVIPVILLAVLFLMVLNEKNAKQKIAAFCIIILSGLLGTIALGESNVKNPLLVLSLGFFAVPSIILSLQAKAIIVKQNFDTKKISTKKVFENSLLSVLGAAFVSIFPGIGPNQAALIIRKFVGKIKRESYLVLIGGINTSNMFFSFTALYVLGKTRTGIAAAIKQLVELQQEQMIALAGIAFIAIGFGAIATIALGKIFLREMDKFDYKKINLAVLGFIIFLAFIYSNSLGLIAFSSATLIGYGAVALGTKRSNCMAFLIIPTIIHYLKIV